MKILFGGSFNPIGFHHIWVAQHISKSFEVVFCPCYNHKFGKDLAPAEDRLKMVQLALDYVEDDMLTLSSYEIDTKSDGSTYNTLVALGLDGFLIGSDNLDDLEKWHNYDKLQKFTRIVIPRTPVSATLIRDRLQQGLDCSPYLFPPVIDYIKEKGLYEVCN